MHVVADLGSASTPQTFVEHTKHTPPGILVGGCVACEIPTVVVRSRRGWQVGWLDAVPGVGVVMKLVVVRSFVAPETVHSDLRELGGGPHLVGVAGDEEDGTVGAFDRYFGPFELLRLRLQDIEGVRDRGQWFAAEGPRRFGTRQRREHEPASDVTHDGLESWVVCPQEQGQLATARGANYPEPVAAHRGLVFQPTDRAP